MKLTCTTPKAAIYWLTQVACIAASILLTACGGGGSGSSGIVGETPGSGSAPTSGGPIIGTLPASASQLKLAAGNIGTLGNIDGPASAARFITASNLTIDSLGNTVVWDAYYGVLRKISPSGQVSTLASHYVDLPQSDRCADGQGTAANIVNVTSMAAGNSGDVYVIDVDCDAIRKISGTGFVSTIVPQLSQKSGAVGTNYGWSGIAFDRNTGNLYATTYRWFTVKWQVVHEGGAVVQITPAGTVSTIAGKLAVTGYADGPGTSALFNQPTEIVADSNGNLFINDCGNGAIRKIDKAANVSTFTVPSPGAVECTSKLAMGTNGNLVLVDQQKGIERISSIGQVISKMSVPTNPNMYDNVPLATRSMIVDSYGNLLFANRSSVELLTPNGSLITLAGIDIVEGSADGIGQSAQFTQPGALATDMFGNLYIADTDHSTIRKMTPGGMVTTFAGVPRQMGAVDGIGAAARFGVPKALAMDPKGNLYVLDYYETPEIRKITPEGTVSTVLKTTSDWASSNSFKAIAIDANGALYVSVDNVASTNSQIMKLGGTGLLATYLTASGKVRSFSVDGQGNIYAVVNFALRKMTPQGAETIIAGTPGNPNVQDGTGGNAGLGDASTIVVDAGGNFFLVDTTFSLIRRVTPQGAVSTYLGTLWSSGIFLGAAPSSLYQPQGIAIAGTTLYLTSGNAVLYTGQ
ncbi:NHL domain-containing protein [Undibacterium terreum]|uniref:Teneurin NHL domain-containing protein n=1 Tax=Undibacterium terreum TaxID=1224302 RepID=A0A916UTS7_9BURK|nr:hypothetical protein [Undibacterium terreum]GGC87536.1 hypothetical protein GCM10011396_38510 [Undibacterium terreum]